MDCGVRICVDTAVEGSKVAARERVRRVGDVRAAEGRGHFAGGTPFFRGARCPLTPVKMPLRQVGIPPAAVTVSAACSLS